jgi:hypothetical protein
MIEKPSAGDQAPQQARCLALDHSGGRSCQHWSQNAETLADVGATAGVANKNAPGCASSAKQALHAGQNGRRCWMLLRQYESACESSV